MISITVRLPDSAWQGFPGGLSQRVSQFSVSLMFGDVQISAHERLLASGFDSTLSHSLAFRRGRSPLGQRASAPLRNSPDRHWSVSGHFRQLEGLTTDCRVTKPPVTTSFPQYSIDVRSQWLAFAAPVDVTEATWQFGRIRRRTVSPERARTPEHLTKELFVMCAQAVLSN